MRSADQLPFLSACPSISTATRIGNLSIAADVDEIWNGPIAVELRTSIKRNEAYPVCKGAPCGFAQNMNAGQSLLCSN